MKVIAGLGNIGSNYSKNRHNVGFILLDLLVDKRGVAFAADSKFDGEIAKLGSDIILVKPSTYMNESGVCIQKLLSYFKLTSNDLYVIQDDVDLEFGKVRLSYNSSAAGHHGIESIIQHLGTQEFHRLRVGVGRPTDARFDVADYVLSDFSSEQLEQIKSLDVLKALGL